MLVQTTEKYELFFQRYSHKLKTIKNNKYYIKNISAEHISIIINFNNTSKYFNFKNNNYIMSNPINKEELQDALFEYFINAINSLKLSEEFEFDKKKASAILIKY